MKPSRRNEMRVSARGAAAMRAAQESPEGRATRADVANYATGGVIVLNYELRAG